jgi:hypothetical protein
LRPESKSTAGIAEQSTCRARLGQRGLQMDGAFSWASHRLLIFEA